MVWKVFGRREKKVVWSVGVETDYEQVFLVLKDPADQPLLERKILGDEASGRIGRASEQPEVLFPGFPQGEKSVFHPEKLGTFRDEEFAVVLQGIALERDFIEPVPGFEYPGKIGLLHGPFLVFQNPSEQVRNFLDPFLLLIVEAPSVFGIDVEHSRTCRNRHSEKTLDVGFSGAVERKRQVYGRRGFMDLVEVDCLPDFLDLRENSALFERKGHSRRDELAEDSGWLQDSTAGFLDRKYKKAVV